MTSTETGTTPYRLNEAVIYAQRLTNYLGQQRVSLTFPAHFRYTINNNLWNNLTIFTRHFIGYLAEFVRIYCGIK